MSPLLPAQLVALALLLTASALCSGSESAFFALDTLRLRDLDQRYPRRAARVRKILDAPTRLLSALLVTNIAINMAISTLAFAVAVQVAPPRYQEAAAGAGALLFLLVFGEIGPKRIALGRPVPFAAWMARPLRILIAANTPARYLLELLTRAFASAFHPRGRILNEDEMETAWDVSAEAGVLDPDERAMLGAILALEEKQASDVMTPRVDVRGIDLEDPPEDIEAFVRDSRVSHLVLYRHQLDRVEGLLPVRRFLLDPGKSLAEAAMPPVYVPETSALDNLLDRFLREGIRIAVVVDEFGGMAGIITRGDLAEEIVGEVEDELGPRILFEPAGERRWLVDGQVSLDDLNRGLDLDLSAAGADRVAGWIHERLKRLPRPGESVEGSGCRMTVRQMRRQRITMVEVEVLPPDAGDGETP